MESNANPNDQQRIPLSQEELKVLKECRFNSIFYRGLPTASISILLIKAAENYGLLRKRSLLFYAGIFSAGFFFGVGSYRNQCIEKILALENSVLADQYRNFSRRHGLPVKEKVTEFTADSGLHSQIVPSSTEDNIYQKKSLERKNRWEEIREASKQRSRGGTSYDDLKKNSTEPSESSNDDFAYNETSDERNKIQSANRFPGKNSFQASKRTNSYGDDME
ncbi:OCIA domain-containing protein 1 isoform X1 [Hydra vulgaris]|uniref:OCIA domain-containing protein 1 isoform X1 n=1 Tax=Hydra vulgaris TaxID=6087 RepID=UPI0002B4A5FC|nr:OCIA domain-containing protein 1 [Hydra vulgaris]